MKKSLIAAGVIVALGAIWAGSAWYTGKQLESNMDELFRQANKEIQKRAPDANVEISWQNYHRGIFSTQLQLVAKPIPGKETTLLNPADILMFDEVIDHGPLPLSSVLSANIIPAMAAIKTTPVNNAASKEWFTVSKGEIPFTLNTRVAYDGNSKSTLKFKPLDYTKDNNTLTFSGAEFQIDVDRSKQSIRVNGESDGGQIIAHNEYNQKVQLTFKNLKTEGDSDMSHFNAPVGKQDMSIEQISIGIDGQELVTLNDMKMAGQTSLSPDGKTINSQADCTISGLKVQNQDFGNGKLTMKLENLDSEAWSEFNQKYNSEVQSLLARSDKAIDPEQYRQELIQAMARTAPILLKGSPTLSIAPLSWRNDKGESTFSLSMKLKDPTQNNSTSSTATDNSVGANLQMAANSSIQSVDSKLVIPVDMATALMTKIAGLEGAQPEDAKKQAEQQVNGLAMLGQTFHITTMENNAITSTFHYADGQITLNGQQMPVEKFTEFLGFMDQ